MRGRALLYIALVSVSGGLRCVLNTQVGCMLPFSITAQTGLG